MVQGAAMFVASKFAVGAIAAALLAGSSASAAVYEETYWGTVFGSVNTTGEFGTTGSLDGDPFVARYVYNTALGVRNTVPGSLDDLYGGSLYGLPGPSPVSAAITINGVTESFFGSYYAEAYDSPAYLFVGTQEYSNDKNLYINNGVSSEANAGGYQPSLDVTIPLTTLNLDGGLFRIDEYNYNLGSYDHYAEGDLHNIKFQISAVPEPATWAMMLAGFFGLGATIRANHRYPQVAVT